ncbi:pirin family protein [Fulvimarina sp. MAC8]|uniref:pirin family protein n=1 Tax=Fulvimarina sp. MAC8 TaxID=3162874 RepID=UPI0032ED06AA
MQILRASQRITFTMGPFRIERVRPGLIAGASTDPAFGPLASFDHASLDVGTVIPMHKHVNDEILSYMWRGAMLHADRTGHKIPISATKLMMMNAGKSFWHEERTPDEPVEMLQIFVRPRDADLSPEIAFFDRPEGTPRCEWSHVAGPEGSEAPLTFRNAVHVFDTRLDAGDEIEVLTMPGLSPFLYVLDGAIGTGGEALGKGDGVGAVDGALPQLTANEATSLVLFLVDRQASSSMAGTISGRRDRQHRPSGS